METPKTPEAKSRGTQQLHGAGLDDMFNRLCAAGTPPEEDEGDPDSNTIPQEWMESFNYIQDNVSEGLDDKNRRTCVTEEERQEAVNKIINGVDREEIVKFLEGCRRTCEECIANFISSPQYILLGGIVDKVRGE